MIVRSELYFPGIDFEFPDPPSPKTEEHVTLSSRLRAKLKHDVGQVVRRDSLPPPVEYAHNPHWTWPGILKSIDLRLEALKDRYGVTLPMDRVDIEMVRRASLVPQNGREKDQLIDDYGKDAVGVIIGLHRRSNDGNHSIRVGYYGEQYSKTQSQVERTITHELGHVFGEFALFGVEYEELKGYAMQALLMGSPETATTSTGSAVHDRSRNMLAQLGSMGICEPAILAHVSGVSFGEYGPLSYLDLKR